MKFRRLLLVSLLLAAPGWARLGTGGAQAERPNVVVFLADDQGWGDLSFNGNGNLHTPHIDSLAGEGVAFDRFYVSPVCAPTRAEFLTGRYHPRTGVSGVSRGKERLNLDETIIAQAFQQAGYGTGLFGKWHNGMQYPYHPSGRGFDAFYGFCSGHWGHYFSPMLERNGCLVEGEGYLPDDLTSQAMRFMRERSEAGQPFFACLAFNTPHSPMQVPDEYWQRFASKDLAQRHAHPEREDIDFTRAALAMVENIDWNVGRVLDLLKELGLERDTIVIYFSDNGPNSWRWNGRMRGKKGSTDEGGVRSPLHIRWPEGVPAGARVRQIAGAIDLFPTLQDLCSLPAIAGKPLDGISLAEQVTGKAAQAEERMVFSHHNGRISVRTQRYRLDHEGRLYDMEADPGQTKDIADSQPLVAARLRSAVAAWRREVVPANSQDDDRPFTLGHPDFRYTQLPARDGHPHGGIQRSNRFPNCSYFTNWTNTADRITWDVEVLADGLFEVEVYYACPAEDVGSTIELSLGASLIRATVADPHDPPLIGAAEDRIPRQESYVKDFKPMSLGQMRLAAGRGQLVLRALDIPGEQAMEVRLLMFTRTGD